MMIEFDCVQAAAMALAIVAAMAVILALRRSLPGWIVMCFELLLFSIVARRVDDLSNWLWGVDLISSTANLVISWMTTAVIVWSFAQAYRRQLEVRRLDEVWNERVAALEELRRESERRGGDWEHMQGMARHTRRMTSEGLRDEG